MYAGISPETQLAAAYKNSRDTRRKNSGQMPMLSDNNISEFCGIPASDQNHHASAFILCSSKELVSLKDLLSEKDTINENRSMR